MTEPTQIAVVLPMQLSPASVQAIVDYEVVMDSLHEQQEKAHSELWSNIHAAHPELDEDACYSLDKKYLKQGVVMLKDCGCHGEKGDAPDFLKALLKKALTGDAKPKSMTNE